jgi:4-amino-4-deoxy-L-arabinose transferase-like glycosyltransferase
MRAMTWIKSPLNWVVLVGALAIRLIGVTWALPYLYHPDEAGNYGVFHTMVRDRTLNPRWFHYPSLFFEIQALVHGAYEVVASTSLPVLQTGANGVMYSSGPLLAGRAVTVLTGVALVGAGMTLAWTLTQRQSMTALAGALLAVHPILVRNARWVTPDTLVGLTVTVALVAAVLVARRPLPKYYLIAGVAIGLAVSSKYNAGIVVVALVVAHVLAKGDIRSLGLAAIAAATAFLVTTPFAVFDFGTFARDVWFEIRHYSTGHAGYEGDSLGTNIAWLWNATGPLLLMLFLVPWVTATVRRLLIVPLAFVVAYGALVGLARVRFERNLVPLIPALLVIASVVIVDVLARRRVLALTAAALALWPASFALRDARDALRDERADARMWIARNMPSKSTIIVDAYAPYVDPNRFDAVAVNFALLEERSAIERAEPDAVIVTALGSGRYLSGVSARPAAARTLTWLEGRACGDVSFGRGQQHIRVLQLSCDNSQGAGVEAGRPAR